MALSTLGVLLLILERRLGVRAAIFLGACSAVVVVDAGLNMLLGPTPDIGGVDSLLEANFPSGHVAYATGLFGGAAVLALMWDQRDIAAVAAAVPAFGGPAQVVYAAHLISDVLAGYALGLAWVSLMLLVFWVLAPPGGHRDP